MAMAPDELLVWHQELVGLMKDMQRG